MQSSLATALLMAAGLIASGLLAPGVAAAGPMVMGPLYAEPARSTDTPAPPGAGGCPVQITELIDSRREPGTLGSVITFRAIQAPPDREAWLRSVFEVGLAARGFKPAFAAAGSEAAAGPGVVTARIRIHALWISLLAMNKTGSVVLRASTAAAGAAPGPEKIYRGDKMSLNMWGSQGEFNGLLNQVFADALDEFADDLRSQCSLGAPPTPAT